MNKKLTFSISDTGKCTRLQIRLNTKFQNRAEAEAYLNRVKEVFKADFKDAAGGPDCLAKKAFTDYSVDEFVEDALLRAKALRWLKEKKELNYTNIWRTLPNVIHALGNFNLIETTNPSQLRHKGYASFSKRKLGEYAKQINRILADNPSYDINLPFGLRTAKIAIFEAQNIFD